MLGFLGQGLFSLRMVWQWLASEIAGESIVPLGFWYCSLGGGILLLIYAIQRHDLVFTLGQSTGVLVYLRNLQLNYRKQLNHTPVDEGQ